MDAGDFFSLPKQFSHLLINIISINDSGRTGSYTSMHAPFGALAFN